MIVSLNQRIAGFEMLGKLMICVSENQPWPGYSIGLSEQEYVDLIEIIDTNHHSNGWFTPVNVRKALREWGNALKADSLRSWLNSYKIDETKNAVNVGIICAGNIPMVGFHDVLCVIMSGNRALIKLSSEDNRLIPALMKLLVTFEPQLADSFEFVGQKMTGHGAAIATGSNNTSRYFNYYFREIPHIIRRSRTSVAVITGTETKEELKELGKDIFDYFGLGCRNVSKIFVPENYRLDNFFEAIYEFHPIVDHHKYANNYDYNKAVWLLNREDLLDNGFILLKQEEALASPTASLYYEYYSNEKKLEEKLQERVEEIQCIVGKNYIPFGEAQSPGLADYADGVDTMKFLLDLKS